MVNPHIKFEMSTITCNEKMKSNAKCTFLVLSHPLGELGMVLYGIVGFNVPLDTL